MDHRIRKLHSTLVDPRFGPVVRADGTPIVRDGRQCL